MPISTEHAGRTYPPTPAYRISRTKIVEFVRVIQDENLAYFGDHPIIPSTFVAVITVQAWGSLFGDEELGLAPYRTVHADRTFDSHRLLRESDDVVARLVIKRVRSRGSLGMVTILVALTIDDGAACDARSALMHIREGVPHD